MISTSREHIEDGALLRLVDDALEDDERTAVLAHMTDCAECGARADRLRELSGAWSAVLVRTDPIRLRGVTPARPSAQPSTRGRGLWLRAASLLFALALASLASPPVRAWLAERWTALQDRDEPASASPAVPGDRRQAGALIVFAHADTSFSVAFSAFQETGELEIVFAADASGEIVAEAMTGQAELLVGPGSLRIANSTSAGADYRITVNDVVRVVYVTVGAAGTTGAAAVRHSVVRRGPAATPEAEVRRLSLRRPQ